MVLQAYKPGVPSIPAAKAKLNAKDEATRVAAAFSHTFQIPISQSWQHQSESRYV